MENSAAEKDEIFFYKFPPVETARKDGLLAAGGNLSPGMLISAYSQGIFPWYSENDPILWWSPDPRFVLFPEELHISGSMKKLLKKKQFNVDLNVRFREIINNCKISPRKGQDGTWITEKMEKAYCSLFKLGYINCAAVTEPDSGKLVGGVYGVRIGSCFCGESMFSKADNASKYGFIKLVEYLKNTGVKIIDCQMRTPLLESFGGKMIPRNSFLKYLNNINLFKEGN